MQHLRGSWLRLPKSGGLWRRERRWLAQAASSQEKAQDAAGSSGGGGANESMEERPQRPLAEPRAPGEFGAVPVESVSVAKGLVLNRIDRRMLVFPELETKEELDRLHAIRDDLEAFLDKECDPAAIDKEGVIPDSLWKGLRQRGLMGLSTAKAYGGLGLSRKESCLLWESLGRDWSVFASLAVHSDLVAAAIETYGSEEQKLYYLPRLASGEFKAAWAASEEGSGWDLASIETRAEVDPDGKGGRLLHGRKSWVTNGRDANLLLVFASVNPKPRLGSEAQYNPLVSAFLVERSSAVKATRRRSTIGLRGAEIWDLELDGVPVGRGDLLGGEGRGFEIASRIGSYARLPFGAAVAAWMRRLLGQIAERANSELRFEGRLSNNASVQNRVQDLAAATFALESLTYYVAGLPEEDDVVDTEGEVEVRDFSLDNDIAHRMAKKVLHQGVTAAMELLGSSALSENSEITRLFRDAASLTGFLGHPDVLCESITLDVLTTWAAEHAGGIAKLRRPDHNPFYFVNSHWQRLKARYAPVKLHYLNERLHPSLEDACRLFEMSIGRFEVMLTDLLENYGRGLEEEAQVMERITEVMTELNAMVALLARTSRSYAVGLRNSDEELIWTHGYINEGRRRITERMEQIISVQHMHRDDLIKKATAQHLLDANKYPIAHPLDRNW